MDGVLVMTTIKADKFQAFLTRSLTQGLSLARDPRDESKRRYFVRSLHDKDRVYVTTPSSCTCHAGQYDKPCVHRARVIYEMGLHTNRVYVADEQGNAVVWTVSPLRGSE